MTWWNWLIGGSAETEHRALRARCRALGFAMPRSLVETVGDLGRVAARKRRATEWRRPADADHARFDALIDVFADMFVAVATPDGETWILAERLFAGFPDPPAYMVAFLDADGAVAAAADLDFLPGAWMMPADHAG